MKDKPLILVTNDDGITAPGIRALVEVMSEIGEVVVVAPDSPQSGQGHALTLNKPLRLEKMEVFEGIEAYACSGTPVDCVKLAKNVVLKDRKIDLCVSGVNHGSNASINIIYSGTVSAAMEASFEGINSIGFSNMAYGHDMDMGPAKHFIRPIVLHVLEHGLTNCKLLNVNIPDLPVEKIKGLKVCRQAKAKWSEDYVTRQDPMGKDYYWLTGKFINCDEGTDTDVWALENGFVSIVPSQPDLTAFSAIDELKPIEETSFANKLG